MVTNKGPITAVAVQRRDSLSEQREYVCNIMMDPESFAWSSQISAIVSPGWWLVQTLPRSHKAIRIDKSPCRVCGQSDDANDAWKYASRVSDVAGVSLGQRVLKDFHR